MVLYLSIFRIPAHHVLFATAKAVGIGKSVQQEMAKFVREGEVDPALRAELVVVDNAPALSSSRGFE